MNANLLSWGVETYSSDIMWADILENKNESVLMFLNSDFIFWVVYLYTYDYCGFLVDYTRVVRHTCLIVYWRYLSIKNYVVECAHMFECFIGGILSI